jgi:hypothetical protein
MPSKCVAGETVSQEEQGGELPPVQHGSAALKSLSEETTAGTAWDFLCGAIDTSRIWGIDPVDSEVSQDYNLMTSCGSGFQFCGFYRTYFRTSYITPQQIFRLRGHGVNLLWFASKLPPDAERSNKTAPEKPEATELHITTIGAEFQGPFAPFSGRGPHSDNPVLQDLALGTRVTGNLSHHWVRIKGAVNDCVWITSCSFQHVFDFFAKHAIVRHRIGAFDSE